MVQPNLPPEVLKFIGYYVYMNLQPTLLIVNHIKEREIVYLFKKLPLNETEEKVLDILGNNPSSHNLSMYILMMICGCIESDEEGNLKELNFNNINGLSQADLNVSPATMNMTGDLARRYSPQIMSIFNVQITEISRLYNIQRSALTSLCKFQNKKIWKCIEKKNFYNEFKNGASKIIAFEIDLETI
jgi:hypothetical protein